MIRWTRWLNSFYRTFSFGTVPGTNFTPLVLEPLESRELLSVTPTIQWDGGAETTALLDAMNWTEDRLPTSIDNASISALFSPGTLHLDGTLAVNSISSEVGLDISGQLSVTTDSEILGGLSVSENGTLSVLGGTCSLQGGFIAGNLSVVSGATVVVGADLAVSGTVSLGGTFQVSANQTVTASSGIWVLAAGAAIGGMGQSRFASTQIDVQASASVTNMALESGAVLAGNGTLTVGGVLDWVGGTMSGSGVTAISATGRLNLTAESDGRYLHGRTIANSGTVMWLGGSLGANDAAGGTIRNLAGGAFEANQGLIWGEWVNVATAEIKVVNEGTFRVFAGAGTFEFREAAFQNIGTVEVQSGTLILTHGRSSGPINVATNSTIRIEEYPMNSYFLANETVVSGDGSVCVAGGGRLFIEAGTTRVRNLHLMFEGSVRGPGLLRISTEFKWTGGDLGGTGGSGQTEIEVGAVLNLLGDKRRSVTNRALINKGQTIWDGKGAITRYVGLRVEIFDNTRLSSGEAVSTSDPTFSPTRDAGRLYRAAHPGALGWGADTAVIFEIMGNRTTPQINAIIAAYATAYSRALIPDLENELTATEKQRLSAMLNQNTAQADAAALYYAMFGGIGLGTDKATVYRILSKSNLTDIDERYQALYGTPQRTNALRADLEYEFSGWEEIRVLALYDAAYQPSKGAALRARADAATLRQALYGGWWVDDETIRNVFKGKTQAEIAAIGLAYQTLTPNEGSRNLVEDASLKGGTSLGYYVAGVLQGEPLMAAASRIRQALDQDNDGSITDWDGTDEEAIWKTLAGLRSDERLRVAQFYKMFFTTELSDDLDAELSDNSWLWGYQRAKTFALYEHGGLSLAQRLFYSVQGWGADRAAVRAALDELGQLPLQSNEGPSIESVDQEYRQLSGGTSLADSLRWELGWRDWQRAEKALKGQPTGLVGEANNLLTLASGERDGSAHWDNTINNWFQGWVNRTGTNLDSAAQLVRDATAAFEANGSVGNHEALRLAMDRLREDLQTFEEGRDSLASTFANTLTTAAAVGIGIFTAGSATPVAVLLYQAAGVGALTQAIPRIVIAGQTYELAELPADLATGAIATGTAPFAFYKLAAGATPLRNVFLGALEGAANGGSMGFLTGAMDSAVRAETWDQGFNIGILRVAQNGAVSAAIGIPLGGLIGGVARAVQSVRNTASIRTARVAGQAPTEIWTPNPPGQTRTIEEAIAIARQHGVNIPDDVIFRASDAISHPDAHAEGMRIKKVGGEDVRWKELLDPRTGKIIFRIRPSVLTSDEAIVAVFAHEMHEFNNLRQIFEDAGGVISIDDLIMHTVPDVPGNLHDQAWDIADEFVRRMRGQ